MRKFIGTYSSIFFALPLLFFTGNIFEPLSYPVLLIFMLFWSYRDQDSHMILMLLLILILGDSREYQLFFVKNLRIIAILIVFFRTLVMMGAGRIRLNPYYLYILPFMVIAILGAFRNPEFVTSISKMISYLMLLFVAIHYLPYQIRTRGEGLMRDIVIFIALILLSGLGLIYVLPRVAIMGVRYRGLLGNPNGLGMYCTMVFPIVLITGSLYPKLRRWVLIAAGLVIFSTLLCGSRTALGTVGIFVLLHFFYRGQSIRAALLWIFVLPAIFIFFSVVRLEDLVAKIGVDEYLRVESLATGTGRFLAWQVGWNHIQENFWIGKGFAYEEILFHELADFFIYTEHQGGMHNSYLTFIMNNGIIGFILIALFIIGWMRKMRCRAFAVPFTISMLISASFESWLTSSLNAFSIHFLISLTLLTLYPDLLQLSAPTPVTAHEPAA
ncbi:MAG: O-antigen ligase family protein [Bacteroidia bacterium]|nr:O-antigen ligase family protein [Bacteroidia bacterium]